MSDMSPVIEPKSDQLNSDSLMAGPITIKIKSVTVRPGTEQPVSIFYEGDDGKPWKPCKSMARVLVAAWGPDSSQYAGKSVTLYRDPKVKWAGMEVGGIRISHMTDIAAPLVLALTETKQTRKPFTVKPLKADAAPKSAPAVAPPADDLTDLDTPDDPWLVWLQDKRDIVENWTSDGPTLRGWWSDIAKTPDAPAEALSALKRAVQSKLPKLAARAEEGV